MKTTTDFKEFMSQVDWYDLDINEKIALIDATRSVTDMDFGSFKTKLTDELQNITIVEYPLNDVGLILDIVSRANFVKFLEDAYMYGEDADAYLSWLAEIQKEDSNNNSVKEVTIRSLPMNEIRIIKRISFAYKAKTNVHMATILYRRKLDDRYNTKNEDNIITDTDNNKYPHDELDKLIFEAVSREYKDAKLTTEYEKFDGDKKRNEAFIKSRKCVECQLTIRLLNSFSLLNADYPDREFNFILHLYCIGRDSFNVFSSTSFLFTTKDEDFYSLIKKLADSIISNE